MGKTINDIVDVYNDAGHSGKDLMRPEMQRLLKDIKSHKIEVIVAIKVDRLTRNNYDGFWLLNYCEEHVVKIELILEPYDVSTANGEMIFGMNLVFGQRERKEIGARTKRAMEEMALEKVHPAKAPYGYARNSEIGHLEVEPIEVQVVKEIFELCKQGKSIRSIAIAMKNNNAYLKTGKWTSDRVYKILTNSIYIGICEYGKYCRKPQDILRLAICMCDNYSHTNIAYNKKEMYKYFYNLLKEINIEYRTTTVNFANYPYIMFAISKVIEMDSIEQNRVALYLFNSINYKIKKYKTLDDKEQMF